MEAYYYGFERVGVGSIDAILSAVAIAGKGSHHTESWNSDDNAYGYYSNRPGLPDATNAVDLIQRAAEVAASDVSFLLDELRKAREALADAWDEGAQAEADTTMLTEEEEAAGEHAATFVCPSRNPYRAAVAAAKGDER
jgi:hypothetical protein